MLVGIAVAEECAIHMGFEPILSYADSGPDVLSVKGEELLATIEVISPIVDREGVIVLDSGLIGTTVQSHFILQVLRCNIYSRVDAERHASLPESMS